MIKEVTDKRTAILDAALKLLVEYGFHNTPMSQIAKQAGVSAGIIYHYFEGKDELIHELHRIIKLKYGAALLEGAPQTMEGVEALRYVWLNSYRYYVQHPQETLFLEQFENSPYNKQWADDLDADSLTFLHKVQAAMEAGQIMRLPLMALYSLTIGVAMSLAKQQIAGTVEIDETMLNTVADAVLRSVRTR